jgi:formate dehydrogenase subunit delta
MSHDDKLVYMANQIGRFFAAQGAARAVPAIADHLRKFWTPRMRAEIVAHLRAGGAGLDDLPRQAVAHLAAEDAASAPSTAAAAP